MGFKILSWNVNGLRSFKQPMEELLNDLDADIICLQETKLTRDMLTEDLALVDGYTSYYAFSRRRSGYSGVATYAKNSCTPTFACEGLTGVLTAASSEPSSQKSLTDCKEKSKSSKNHFEGYSTAFISGKISPHVEGFHRLDPPDEQSLEWHGEKKACLRAVIEAATCELAGNWNQHELRELDSEGRTVITVHDFCTSMSGAASSPPFRAGPRPLAVINVYCPRADPTRDDRALYKLQFYRALQSRAAALSKAGARVVVLGDVNTSHTLLDHCDPDGEFHLNPGRQFLDQFLAKVKVERREDGSLAFADDTDISYPEQSGKIDLQSDNGLDLDSSEEHSCARDGEDQVLSSERPEDIETTEVIDDDTSTCLFSDDCVDTFQMVDTFRCLYPTRKDAFTCWNTMSNARETNYGTRLDYIFCDRLLLLHVRDSLVLQHVMGSDHCPVALLVGADLLASPAVPDYCTKNFREFQGQQQKLLNYFQKVGNQKEAKQNGFVGDATTSLPDHGEESDAEGTKGTNLAGFQEEHNPLLKFLSQSQSGKGSDSVNPFPNNNRNQKSSFVSSTLKKKNKNSLKQNHKCQQSNLLSFLGGKRKRSDEETNCVQAKETLLADGSRGKTNKQLSLYEAEMLFLKNNPDVYKRLELTDGRDVDMDILINASGSKNNESLSIEQNDMSSKLYTRNNTDETKPITENQITTDSSASSLQKCNSSNYIFELGNSPTKVPVIREESNEVDRIGVSSATVSEGAALVSSSHEQVPVPKTTTASAWSFMHQKLEVPLCPGHKEPCALRTTKKKGPNFNKRFFACSRGAGRPGDKNAQCNFFKWV